MKDDITNIYMKSHIETPNGTFDIVTNGYGDEYPGVDVEFTPNNYLERTSCPRILFEYHPEKGLRALIWNNPNSEDYSDEIRFKDLT